MKTYWIFFVVAIYALHADKINKAIRADKSLKKVLLATGIGAVSIYMIPILFQILLPA